MDETRVEELISSRTRAIVVTHYAGVACEMDAILEISNRHKIAVIEDNAQGIFGRYRGRGLGSMGALGAISFHETKNITCGEGGALLINKVGFTDRAEILRDMGTNRAQFLRGEVEKYTWVDIGSSFVLSEILAALLVAQLKASADICANRSAIWQRYYRELCDWSNRTGVTLPVVPEHCEHSAHLFYLLLPSEADRDVFIRDLKLRGVQAQSHYEPLHISKVGGSYGYKPGDLPMTENCSRRLVRLPFYTGMTDDEQSQVIEAVIATPLK